MASNGAEPRRTQQHTAKLLLQQSKQQKSASIAPPKSQGKNRWVSHEDSSDSSYEQDPPSASDDSVEAEVEDGEVANLSVDNTDMHEGVWHAIGITGDHDFKYQQPFDRHPLRFIFQSLNIVSLLCYQYQ
jgi:hypothetical protein